ncbi:hypothetical protein AUJ46_04330 [Candidatus Peregrinibacteria bacterium CG1_02_54_53]|nr:MAG: hypothetical protein AUJ46_04330 [Candidatus Peregrinibacteria bacterium CG1_02_54_53]
MQDSTVTERMRLDVFLAAMTDVSRVKAGAIIRAGGVLVNGRIARKPACIVQPGDWVTVTDNGEPASESHISAVNLKLTVLYEDDACLVINKPAGIAVHPAPGLKKDEPTILHGIAFLFKKKHIPFSAATVLAHRLDRETTGCLLIAKSAQSHAALQKQFKDRTIQKSYLAIVDGVPSAHEAHIDAPIGRSLANRTKMSILGASQARSAKTTYRLLSAGKSAALLECDLHTGRTHQIRVHLSAIGHPVRGDATYGSSQNTSLDHLYLHAWRLTFHSPATKKQLTVVAPLPTYFTKTLRTLSLTLSSRVA